MAKYSSVLIACFFLAGCNSSQQITSDAAMRCPQIGIDLINPDFHARHKKKDVESYFKCMEAALEPSGMPRIGEEGSPLRAMLNNADDKKSSLLEKLQYQRNLWRQIFSKEKTPEAAYADWIRWRQLERSISASNDAAASARAAARQAKEAAESQSEPRLWMQNVGGKTYNCDNIGGMVNCN